MLLKHLNITKRECALKLSLALFEGEEGFGFFVTKVLDTYTPYATSLCGTSRTLVF